MRPYVGTYNVRRTLFFPITYTNSTRALFCRTLTSFYDEKNCISCLQPKFTKVSTVFVIDSRKCRR